MTVYGYHCYVKGTQFDNLHDAYLSCSANSQCFGILDGSCDMVDQVTLCMNGIKKSNMDTRLDKAKNNLCIYRKREYHGNTEVRIVKMYN